MTKFRNLGLQLIELAIASRAIASRIGTQRSLLG
jgi:hypothetical protein